MQCQLDSGSEDNDSGITCLENTCYIEEKAPSERCHGYNTLSIGHKHNNEPDRLSSRPSNQTASQHRQPREQHDNNIEKHQRKEKNVVNLRNYFSLLRTMLHETDQRWSHIDELIAEMETSRKHFADEINRLCSGFDNK